MEIISAFWEKVNLGIECKEIILEKNDSEEQLKLVLDQFQTIDYVVVKVPIGNLGLNKVLSDYGFTFIECSLNVTIDPKDAVLLKPQQRLNSKVTYSRMDNTDLEFLFNEIKNGLFSTDRIILDKYFTPELAAKRYINWITEELNKSTEIFKIIYNGITVGFFTFKQLGNGVYYPFLAGIYKSHSNAGLGFVTLRKPIEEVMARNGKSISTYISTNNQPVVRAHIQQGFNINEIQYIFVKHK
jgi:hypothetical protein